MARVLTKAQEIERSIIKKYRKTIWNNFKVDKEFDISVDKVVSAEVSNPLYR